MNNNISQNQRQREEHVYSVECSLLRRKFNTDSSDSDDETSSSSSAKNHQDIYHQLQQQDPNQILSVRAWMSESQGFKIFSSSSCCFSSSKAKSNNNTSAVTMNNSNNDHQNQENNQIRKSILSTSEGIVS